MKHTVLFRPSGRGKAQCDPDPNYPNGKAIELDAKLLGQIPYCRVEIPYPAPECGLWLVVCQTCKVSIGITAAGRPDDPISVTLPCRKPEVSA